MATDHEETLQQRYLREHNEYVAMVKRMTPDQIMALHVELADVTAQRDQLLAALEYSIKQVPELASVPGIAAAIAAVKGD